MTVCKIVPKQVRHYGMVQTQQWEWTFFVMYKYSIYTRVASYAESP